MLLATLYVIMNIYKYKFEYSDIIFEVANASKKAEEPEVPVASDDLEQSSTTVVNCDGKVEEIDCADRNFEDSVVQEKPEHLVMFEKFGDDVTFFREASIYGRG